LDTGYHKEVGSRSGNNGLVGEGFGNAVKKSSTTKGSSDDLRCVEHLESEKQKGFSTKIIDAREVLQEIKAEMRCRAMACGRPEISSFNV